MERRRLYCGRTIARIASRLASSSLCLICCVALRPARVGQVNRIRAAPESAAAASYHSGRRELFSARQAESADCEERKVH